jgi:hypothetical protein
LVDLIKNEMEKYGIQFLKAEIKSVTEVEKWKKLKRKK